MRKLVAALAALPVLLIAGCGGSGEQTVPVATGPELTRSEWIAQADAICALSAANSSFQAEYDRLQGEPPSQEVRHEQAEVFQQGGTELEELAAQLRSLRPPAADQKTVDKFLSDMENVAALMGSVADAIEDADLSKAEKERVWERFVFALFRFGREAQGSGLPACEAEGR